MQGDNQDSNIVAPIRVGADTETGRRGDGRTPLETALTAIWKSTLDLEEIAIDDDFFLFGGDSLMAATLFTEVSAAFGVQLPLNTIFDDASTIEGMARMIEDTRGGEEKTVYDTESSEVVVMSAGTGTATDLPPIFAVGGTGGHSIGFAHVTRLLGADQPFFGLDSVGLDGERQPLTRMDRIAAEHIRRMKTVQPEGPYFLMGACFGGRVVYEMTQQLARAGEEMGLTILLDPSPPHRGKEERDLPGDQPPQCLSRAAATRLYIRDRLKLYSEELRDLTWPERKRYVGDKLRIAMEIGRTGDLHRGDPTQLNWDAVFRANKIAGRSYDAAPYDGPVAVIWSRDRDADSVHRQYHDEWLALLSNKLLVAEVSGTDSGAILLPPNVEALVAHISVALRQVRGR